MEIPVNVCSAPNLGKYCDSMFVWINLCFVLDIISNKPLGFKNVYEQKQILWKPHIEVKENIGNKWFFYLC